MIFSICGEKSPGPEGVSTHLGVDFQVVIRLGRFGHRQMTCPVAAIDISRLMHNTLYCFILKILGLLEKFVVDVALQSHFLGRVGAAACGEPESLETNWSLTIVTEEGGCLSSQGLTGGHLGYGGCGLAVSQQEEQEAEDGGEIGGLSLSEVEGPVGTVLLGPVESIHKPVDVVQES